MLIFFVFTFLYTPSLVFAESSYVLSYPSAMPGSFFYKLETLQEKLLRYWYFGDFGRFLYNIRYSDKYLVEAKTLFEYKQYLLGFEALQKSNYYYGNILSSLDDAARNKKEISEKKNIFKLASQKHIEVLLKMREELPSSFVWTPEKGSASILQIEILINDSIEERQENL